MLVSVLVVPVKLAALSHAVTSDLGLKRDGIDGCSYYSKTTH